MDYITILRTCRNQARGRAPSDPATWAAMLALTQTAEIAGRDLGPATIDWANHAVAIYDAWTTLSREFTPPEDLSPPPHVASEDTPQLRWAQMRLCAAVAQTFAMESIEEQCETRQRAYVRIAGRLTEAAAHLKTTAAV